LSLDVTDLDMANRCAVVIRKGGARDVIVWQTGTTRLLPRMLAGRRRGPVFCTDRAARPSVALVDIDPATGKARLSYRRAAELFEAPHQRPARWTVRPAPTVPLRAHSRRRSRRLHTDADGAVRAHLGPIAGDLRPGFG
jgi:integrase/recombinase XerC/integrase/recombinase XerD